MKFTKKEIDNLIFEMINSYSGAEINEDDNLIPESSIRAVLQRVI